MSPDGSVGPRVDTVARSRLEPSCLRFSKFRKIMRLSSNDNSSIDNFIPFDDFRLLSSSGNKWRKLIILKRIEWIVVGNEGKAIIEGIDHDHCVSRTRN